MTRPIPFRGHARRGRRTPSPESVQPQANRNGYSAYNADTRLTTVPGGVFWLEVSRSQDRVSNTARHNSPSASFPLPASNNRRIDAPQQSDSPSRYGFPQFTAMQPPPATLPAYSPPPSYSSYRPTPGSSNTPAARSRTHHGSNILSAPASQCAQGSFLRDTAGRGTHGYSGTSAPLPPSYPPQTAIQRVEALSRATEGSGGSSSAPSRDRGRARTADPGSSIKRRHRPRS